MNGHVIVSAVVITLPLSGALKEESGGVRKVAVRRLTSSEETKLSISGVMGMTPLAAIIPGPRKKKRMV